MSTKKIELSSSINFYMGRYVGIEPTHTGTTIQRVNHFTNTAIKFYSILTNFCLFDKFFYVIIVLILKITYTIYRVKEDYYA